MVQRRQRERSLFEILWPDWLRKIDTLLEDEAVIEVVAQVLERRWSQSRRRGRPGTPAEVVIRMLILKHLFDWSYDELEQEVHPNLVYRAFTRIDAGDVPDAKTILKIARQRWFRRGQRWRVGCEGRISVLKRRHGLDRCRYHGEDGMHRWGGLGVIANNSVSTATFSKARAAA